MDERDQVVTKDSELLEWFYLDDFDYLAVAFSEALGDDVLFLERQVGQADDEEVSVVVGVGYEAFELGYPFTIRGFLTQVVNEWANAPSRLWRRMIEAEIRRVERIGVQVQDSMATTELGRGHPDDPDIHYPFVKACKKSITGAAWRRTRFEPNFPGVRLIFLNPDGSRASGKTLMGNMRRTWAEHLDDEPPNIDVADLVDQLAVRAQRSGLLHGHGVCAQPLFDPDLGRAVEDLDELVTLMGAGSVDDLSRSLSMAINADVELDEGDVDDTHIVRVRVYDCITELEGPFTMTDVFSAMASSHEHSAPFIEWREFEQKVRDVEGIKVQIWRRPWEVQPGDDLITALRPVPYPYKRAAAGSSTVAAWRRNRITPHYSQFTVTVLDPDLEEVRGQTHMGTLRGAWAQDQSNQRC